VGFIEKFFGKKFGFALCIGASGLLSASFFLIPESNIPLLLGVHILKNLAFGPTAALIWAMYTDAADYGEWKNGRRSTGLVMSACTMAQKLGYTLGGVLSMNILAYIGYQANAVQSSQALLGIKGMVSWIAAIPCAIGFALILFYPLTDKQLKNIEADLKARRANGEKHV
jgi:GPH family glycoside/pentoside/hexuronide:cation symporter